MLTKFSRSVRLPTTTRLTTTFLSHRSGYTWQGGDEDRRWGLHPNPDWDDEIQGVYPGSLTTAEDQDYKNSWSWYLMQRKKRTKQANENTGPDPSMPTNLQTSMVSYAWILVFISIAAWMKRRSKFQIRKK